MKHYRINKLAKPGGMIVKKKDILASGDREAIQAARDDADCPVCDVIRDGTRIGSVE